MAQSAFVRSDRLLGDVKRLYDLLDILEATVGGKPCLAVCQVTVRRPHWAAMVCVMHSSIDQSTSLDLR